MIVEGGVILEIKLICSLVPCFPMNGSGIQTFFKLEVLPTITFSVLRLCVVVEGENKAVRFPVSLRDTMTQIV